MLEALFFLAVRACMPMYTWVCVYLYKYIDTLHKVYEVLVANFMCI